MSRTVEYLGGVSCNEREAPSTVPKTQNHSIHGYYRFYHHEQSLSLLLLVVWWTCLGHSFCSIY